MKTKYQCLVKICLAIGLSLVSVSGIGSALSSAKDGVFEDVEALVNNNGGVDVNENYADGTSALHWASYHNNLNGVEVLLAAGADVNATTDLGVTPLWLAAQNGGAEIVQRLLEAGANPNITLRSGESPLMAAAKSGNETAVKALLEAGGDPNVTTTRGQNALMWASAEGHAGVVKNLLIYKADPNARTDVHKHLVKTDKETDGHPDYKKWNEEGASTALMFAAVSGDLSTVRNLLEGGSEINAVSALGLDAAKMAIYSKNTDVLELLLERGANPDLAEAGYTSLHAAILVGSVEATKLLLESGANANALVRKATATRRESLDFHFHESFVGATPLWLAARFTEPVIMRLLIEHGSDPEFILQVTYPVGNRDEHSIFEEGGVSVLMAAVGMGNQRLRGGWANSDRNYGGQTLKPKIQESVYLECVKIAVDEGADIYQLDGAGVSALDVARNKRFSSIVAFLESRED